MPQIACKEMRRKGVLLAALVGVCVLLMQTISFAQGEPEKDGRYFEAQARQAYAAKDYSSFLLNLSKAAAHLQISPKTLRLAAECREIDALRT